MSEAGQFAMWLAVGAASVGFWSTTYPLVRAWARRIEAPAAEADLLARLEALEQRGMDTGEVELTRQRMAELEERLDFAERLLAQPREVPRVAGSVEPGQPG